MYTLPIDALLLRESIDHRQYTDPYRGWHSIEADDTELENQQIAALEAALRDDDN